MQEEEQYTDIDFARALQAAACDYGFIVSIKIDKASGNVVNTAFSNNKIYAIDPQYSVAPGGGAVNKVWEYQ